jgi:type II secretory pathway predicted ATPase ExeA
MYESYFGLSRRPFATAADPSRYFAASAIESARQALARGIARSEGPAILLGGPGTGKSLLCQMLAREFEDSLTIALLDSAFVRTQKGLLQAILHALKLPFRGSDEGELRLSLIDYLSRDEAEFQGLLLLIDEAQLLSSPQLQELRLISNVARQGEPSVRLVLAGTAALDERLADPKLATLQQRIAVRTYLEPFSYDESLAFIRELFQQAGRSADEIFSFAALERIHRQSEGIPRLIQYLCDHVLVLAYAGGIPWIESSGVDEAWADLQQLRIPTSRPIEPQTLDNAECADVIEFGQLEEDDANVVELDPDTIRMERSFDALTAQVAELECEGRLGSAPEPEVEVVFPLHAWDGSGTHEEFVEDRYARLDAHYGTSASPAMTTVAPPLVRPRINPPEPKPAPPPRKSEEIKVQPPVAPPSHVAPVGKRRPDFSRLFSQLSK